MEGGGVTESTATEKVRYVICTQILPDGLGDATYALNALSNLREALKSKGVSDESYDIAVVFDDDGYDRFQGSPIQAPAGTQVFSASQYREKPLEEKADVCFNVSVKNKRLGFIS